jgi:hypothetical protein
MVRPGVGRPASRWRVLRHLTTEQAKDDRALSSDTSFRASAPASHVARARRIGAATGGARSHRRSWPSLGGSLPKTASSVHGASSRWAPSPRGYRSWRAEPVPGADDDGPDPRHRRSERFRGFRGVLDAAIRTLSSSRVKCRGKSTTQPTLADMRRDICRKNVAGTRQLRHPCGASATVIEAGTRAEKPMEARPFERRRARGRGVD